LPATFGIVDLFAGPGGLGEGFASLRVGDHSPFQIGISVEKERSAHRTLTLRAFVRAYAEKHGALPTAYIDFHAGQSAEPDWSTVDAVAWDHAASEARCLELGTEPAAEAIDSAIARLRKDFDDTILIGGPPCQAYSLVGRARANGKIGYVPEEDARHYLFREYIRVLDRLRPAAFVMENVKGMLSSTIESRMVFEMLMEDLTSLGTGHAHHYELRAIRLSDGKATLLEPQTAVRLHRACRGFRSAAAPPSGHHRWHQVGPCQPNVGRQRSCPGHKTHGRRDDWKHAAPSQRYQPRRRYHNCLEARGR
jgi:DNA (cytosine-5)-methyltransferase 1